MAMSGRSDISYSIPIYQFKSFPLGIFSKVRSIAGNSREEDSIKMFDEYSLMASRSSKGDLFHELALDPGYG